MTKPTIDKRTAVVLMGVFAATLTDAIAGSTLSFIRFDMMGDVYASADEAAIFDYGYTAAKIVGFIFAAWVSSAQPLRPLLYATIAITVACALIITPLPLHALAALRIVQGFAGGAAVVSVRLPQASSLSRLLASD